MSYLKHRYFLNYRFFTIWKCPGSWYIPLVQIQLSSKRNVEIQSWQLAKSLERSRQVSTGLDRSRQAWTGLGRSWQVLTFSYLLYEPVDYFSTVNCGLKINLDLDWFQLSRPPCLQNNTKIVLWISYVVCNFLSGNWNGFVGFLKNFSGDILRP